MNTRGSPAPSMAKLKRSKRAKQWNKGQSAASNPSATKHREEASRRTRKGGRSDGGNLTVEAMAEHDENVAESLETKSIVSVGTIETEFASGAYDGTPFESIRRLWGSSLPIHREVSERRSCFAHPCTHFYFLSRYALFWLL